MTPKYIPDAGSPLRMPQLDGLRTLAVTAVAFSHWTPEQYQLNIPWGTGVQLFFVLSGFLITGILLRNRPKEFGGRLKSVLRLFYMRRFLRIFPLYYGVLIVCALFGVGPIASSWPWHFSYLSNVYYFVRGPTAVGDPLRHFWSLSVEEQFYIGWPLLVLTLPKPSVRFMLMVCIVGAAAFRLGMAVFWHISPVTRYLTPSCLDALAIGGLLAYVLHFEGPERLQSLARFLGIVGAIGLVVLMSLNKLTHIEEFDIIAHTFLVMFYGFLVGRAAKGFSGIFGRLLNYAPVQYLGKISYGIYVYHNFAPLALATVLSSVGLHGTLDNHLLIRLVLYSFLTLATATVSWYFYESPINELKRFFDYGRANRISKSEVGAGGRN